MNDELEDKIRRRQRAILDLEDDGHQDVVVGDELDIAHMIQHRMPRADALTHKTSMRADKWSQLNNVAKFGRPNPPTVLQGVIGLQQNIVVTGPEIGNNRSPLVQVANWGGEDAETLPVTVTVSPVQQVILNNPATLLLPPRPFALVRFGTRGYLVEAEVDICTGCEFTVSGSSVTIQVGFEFLGSTVVVPPGVTIVAQMALAGMLSFWPVSAPLPPTRTRFYDFLTEGTPGTLPVPAFAKNVIVMREQIATTEVIQFLDSTNAVRYTFTLGPGIFMTVPIPIATDITSIRVTSTGNVLGTSNGTRLIYQLAL